MALTSRRSSSRGADTGLKGFLTAVPEEKRGKNSTAAVVKKALAATANVHRLMGKADGQQARQGSDELSQARGQTRFTQKDLLKRPAWGSGLTSGKPQQQRTPARHSKTSLASHPHRTQAAETPGAAALPTQRTLAFAHAAALAQERRLEGASVDQGPTQNGSAKAAQGEEAGSPPQQSGQASELAEKEAARRAQAEASWSQSQTLLARAEEATARAQERVTELEEQIAKMRAAEIKRADSEEWLRAEAGRRIEADAKAVHEEARRREVEQRLVVVRKARAELEEKLRSAEGLKGAFEAALVESEAKLQALAEDRAQRKAAPSTAESHLRAANARAEEAELKLEEARKQLTHQVTLANQSVAASTARVTQLEAELRQAQAAHAALQTEKETAAARVAYLREVNADLEAEVSLKSAEVQGLVAEASKLTDEFLAEERQLKGEVASSRAEVAVLKREVASARATLKKLSTPPAKPIKELEHEILTLKQMVATLQAAADSAAIAEATERHARQAELKNAHDHVETLLEQLRIKNEAVDVLEQEADLMAKQRDDDATDRERLAYARLHAIGGKLNESTHKVTQMLAVLKEPSPSTAIPLDYVQTELERIRLFLEAEPCIDMPTPALLRPRTPVMTRPATYGSGP